MNEHGSRYPDVDAELEAATTGTPVPVVRPPMTRIRNGDYHRLGVWKGFDPDKEWTSPVDGQPIPNEPPDEETKEWFARLVVDAEDEFGTPNLDDYEDPTLAEDEQPRWPIGSIGAWAKEVDEAPPVGWLLRNLWPADGYGVIGAEPKSGKTWLVLDLALAVLTGGKWLDLIAVERQGPVLIFLGEGGKRKMVRRIRAIAKHKRIANLDDLPLYLSEKVPHLTNAEQLASIAHEVRRLRPALVIIDPLYLAARGADSSNLLAMGEALSGIQEVCQSGECALVVVHHWNKTGLGSGSRRFSGAGSAEWGRVLISVEAASQLDRRVDHATKVLMTLRCEGDEIPDQELVVLREVWADDPDDLSSPLHYRVTTPAAGSTLATQVGPKLSPSQRAVMDVIGYEWQSADDVMLMITRVDEASCSSISKRSVQQALHELTIYQQVEQEPGWKQGSNLPKRYRLADPCEPLQRFEPKSA